MICLKNSKIEKFKSELLIVSPAAPVSEVIGILQNSDAVKFLEDQE